MVKCTDKTSFDKMRNIIESKQFLFVTHNEQPINLGGTHLQGYIYTDYKTLIEKLGEPSDSYDSYKSDYEWQIEFGDGLVAAIYDWKIGYNYNGKSGEDVTEGYITWNVGGADPEVVNRLQAMLEK
tara:strand:+ start:564 stop:941 length:378 start_codon:yes stop_codon:yes gene_type:complete